MNNLFTDFLLSREELRELYHWLPIDGIEKINDIVNQYNYTVRNGFKIPLILTGQQPAVFGGPLYTFYKIITSLKLSRVLKLQYRSETLPMFWVHSWDHDWKEACSINFLSYNYEILPFLFNPDTGEKGKSLYKLKIDKQYIQEKILDIFNKIRGSEFTNFWREFLINSLVENDTLSDWAVHILKKVFEGENIKWFEPHKTKDFKILKQVIEISIESHQLLFEKFNKTNDLIKKLGYKPKVHKLPENAFFFLEEENYRNKIQFENGTFYSEISKKTYTKSEMMNILNYEPERFSPNILLRCIYQQMLFPCVVYVGGPAEVAYWAQLKDLFSLFNLSVPIIYPRNRFILLPLKIRKWLADLNIDIYDLSKINDSVENTNFFFGSDSQKKEIEIIKMKFIDSANLFFNSLFNVFSDNSLYNYRKKFLLKIDIESQKLIELFLKSKKNKNEIYQKHLYYIKNTLFPNGNDQERFFSPFSFIPEYGSDFIKILKDKTDINNFDIGIIDL